MRVGEFFSLDCIHCGEPSNDAHEYAQEGGPPMCCTCSEIVANVWWRHHSGEWLTWNDSGAEQRQSKLQSIKKTIPEALRWAVFERDGFACKHCGSRIRLTADHIYPESKGGAATFENLQTLCRSCNSIKRDRVPV